MLPTTRTVPNRYMVSWTSFDVPTIETDESHVSEIIYVEMILR